MSDVVAKLRERTGLDVVGAVAFGDTPELQDELLAFVGRGTKRATVGAVDELGIEGQRFPEPALHWGLLDGRGEPRFVMQAVEVTRARMADVTAAFAWDEGDWLREVYTQRWGTTRMVSRGELHDITTLPALVCERDGERIGALTFRPRPGGETECVSVDAFRRGAGVGGALTAGITALARREGWRRLWLITTNDNTPALRAYQRLGWDLVGLRRGAVERARAIKPEIPATGLDGIPLHSELELEIRP